MAIRWNGHISSNPWGVVALKKSNTSLPLSVALEKHKPTGIFL
ncbi:MAG TPA: hypothetical protein VJB41_01235 [Patescibacteria group bacterium]|nr:hypothetical protein [Patescibacteria group bacterium]